MTYSFLLIAFGLDSVLELVSGAILLWRLSVEARGEDTEHIARAEHRASWVIAVSLALLCLYVLGTAIYGLLTQSRPESSLVGIVISIAALLVMPGLGMTKRRLAARIDSSALRGDAASSFTCGYMAGAVLLGVGLNALFHWWWAEDVASLIFLFWLVGETREAFEEAREGREGDEDDHDEGCLLSDTRASDRSPGDDGRNSLLQTPGCATGLEVAQPVCSRLLRVWRAQSKRA